MYERQIMSDLVALIMDRDYDGKDCVASRALRRFGWKRLAAEPATPIVLAQCMHDS